MNNKLTSMIWSSLACSRLSDSGEDAKEKGHFCVCAFSIQRTRLSRSLEQARSSPASRPECRDLPWAEKSKQAHRWKQNCRWTDIKAVPFNINLLLFHKLLSFAVFYVKVRTPCGLPLCIKTGLFPDRQCGMSNADRRNFKKVFMYRVFST